MIRRLLSRQNIQLAAIVFSTALLFCVCFSVPKANAAFIAPDRFHSGSVSGGFSDGWASPVHALGGRDHSALTPRNTGSANSATEQYLGGSFIGAMFFGYPYQGVGAVDLVVVLLLAFLLLRTFRLRKKPDDKFNANRHTGSETDNEDTNWPRRNSGHENKVWRTSEENDTNHDPRDNAWSRRMKDDSKAPEQPRRPSPWDTPERKDTRPPVTARDRATAMWVHLSSEPKEEKTAPAALVAEGAHVPSHFDVADFLEGARALYVRLQQSWAARKVDDLEPFTTPEMIRLLKNQAEKNPDPVPVAILLVNATLQDVSELHEREQATVLFNVLMRVGKEAEQEEINEIWRFVRGDDTDGMWRLAGIAPAA